MKDLLLLLILLLLVSCGKEMSKSFKQNMSLLTVRRVRFLLMKKRDFNKFYLGEIFIEPCTSDSSKWILFVDVWYKRDVDYEDYASRRTVINSCAVMENNKFVLPEWEKAIR